MKRTTSSTPAFDCVANCTLHTPPCKGVYGRGAERWLFHLYDAHRMVGMSLELFTNIGMSARFGAWDWSANLGLHAGFPMDEEYLLHDAPKPLHDDCAITGGACYSNETYYGTAKDLLALVDRKQIAQSGEFWQAYEKRVLPIMDRAVRRGRAVARMERCTCCDGKGYRERA